MTLKYYVYLLLLSSGHIYSGYTTDLKRRMTEHTNGRVSSTRHSRPLEMIHCEAYAMESDARRRERYLKSTEGKRFLRQQIRDLLAEKRVAEKRVLDARDSDA